MKVTKYELAIACIFDHMCSLRHLADVPSSVVWGIVSQYISPNQRMYWHLSEAWDAVICGFPVTIRL